MSGNKRKYRILVSEVPLQPDQTVFDRARYIGIVFFHMISFFTLRLHCFLFSSNCIMAHTKTMELDDHLKSEHNSQVHEVTHVNGGSAATYGNNALKVRTCCLSSPYSG